MAQKKAAFAALPFAAAPQLVLADLQALNQSTAAFVGALFGYWVFRRRSARAKKDILGETKMEGPYETLGSTRQPTELSNKEAAVHEMDSARSPSLYESLGTPLSELPVAAVSQRSGLHEMPG